MICDFFLCAASFHGRSAYRARSALRAVLYFVMLLCVVAVCADFVLYWFCVFGAISHLLLHTQTAPSITAKMIPNRLLSQQTRKPKEMENESELRTPINLRSVLQRLTAVNNAVYWFTFISQHVGRSQRRRNVATFQSNRKRKTGNEEEEAIRNENG